jgi:hypothetical protein
MIQPNLLSEIPDYINPDLWTDFIQHRKEIRHKLTPTATKFLLRKLEKFHSRGIDVNLSITQAIENGWQGIFEHDNYRRQNGNGQRETPVQIRERQADECRAEIFARHSAPT